MSPYGALKPLLFSLPPETVHGLVSSGLRAIQETPIEAAVARRYAVEDARLRVTAFDLEFPNPVGIAAGFDKNAKLPRSLAALGFGHVEVGGVTATPQPGNPRPRLFRLSADGALINRMGFNNEGAERIGERLDGTRLPDVPVGVNIGKSKSTPLPEAPDDYAYTYERLAEAGDYFVVNVSSPNTPGLRELQSKDALERILVRLQDIGAGPLLVKLSPDLAESAILEAVELAEELGVDGLIATNTTVDRPRGLSDAKRREEGGLSGRPLEARATQVVRLVAAHTDVPVIGVGGIFTARDAYRKIRSGASLVQLYTGFIYRGPAIAREINHGLLALLDRDGFDSVTEAVGVDVH